VAIPPPGAERPTPRLGISEDVLARAVTAGRLGIFERDLRTGQGHWSVQMWQLFDLPPRREPISTEEWLLHVHPEDRPRLLATLLQAMTGNPEYEIEYRIILPDGNVRWVLSRGEIVCDARGAPVRVAGISHDISDRKQAESKLHHALEQTTEILESIGDAFYALDQEWRFTYANRRALELWKLRSEEVIGRRFLDVFPQAEGSENYELHCRVMKERVAHHTESVSTIVNRWLTVSIYPTSGGGLSTYFQDITERKRAEQRARLLAAEVDHRAKNVLAVVQVMLRQTRAATVGEFAAAAQGRIAALARTHTLLAEGRWEGVDLRRLVEDELSPYGARKDNVVLAEGPSVLLSPRAAQSFAMALHELATNGIKYGALSVPGGRVAVAWSLASDNTLSLTWSETGGPPVVPPSRRGLGTIVIEQSVGEQLGGQFAFDWRPEGLSFSVAVPMPPPVVGETSAVHSVKGPW
jgi:PAS domain S-box-containing protein